MGVRLRATLYALSAILLITFACLAFMPWPMDSVIPELEDVRKCMILRYDEGAYDSAYPEGEDLDELTDALLQTTGHFDRKRAHFVYPKGKPLYRVYLWDSAGRLPDLWICDTALFYDETQFVLDDANAAALNGAIASCFE